MAPALTSLQGVRLLVTRAEHQARQLAGRIEELGGIPVNIPLLAINPPKEMEDIRRVMSSLSMYDWIVLTSVNGVEMFVEYAHEFAGSDWKQQLKKIAAVGRKTSCALEEHGLSVSFIPTRYTADVLFDELSAQLESGTKILLARGNLARLDLPRQLTEIGCGVEDLIVYLTVRNDEVKRELVNTILNEQVDVLTFTSPSTVRYFVQLLEGEDWRKAIANLTTACIGPITAKEAEKFEFPNIITAEDYTLEGLLHTISEHLA